MKIVFCNAFHNGDVHAPRAIIRQIMKKVHSSEEETEFVFSHKNDPTLLADIEGLGYDRDMVSSVSPQESVIVRGNTVFINTWYDQQRQKFAREHGILTLDALYAALNEATNQIWGFTLSQCSENLIDFFPSIDYSFFQIEHAREWIAEHPGKKVLVESGNALSGQASNFPMLPIIERIAESHPDVSFIMTNREKSQLPNIFNTHAIIKKEGTDLNEISYLSSHCNVIIGRASGVFTFALTRENLFERKAKFLCFSHLVSHQKKYWLGRLFTDKIEYSSSFIMDRGQNAEQVEAIIRGNL